MRIAIKFAYDGKGFHGYARQPRLATIEGTLLSVLISCGIINNARSSNFQSASRTDKNVSALGNIAAFNTDTPPEHILPLLNSNLQDIWVYGIAEPPSSFKPRYAKHRAYRYYLPYDDLDFQTIIDTALVFTGKNNFSNFAKVEPHKDPVRIIDNILFTRDNGLLVIDFFAQTFLWKQIRRVVSALIKTGKHELHKQQIKAALINPDNHVDFGLAPPELLLLRNVFYDIDFTCDQTMLQKLIEVEERVKKAAKQIKI